MNIALIGYGQMGHAIEEIALKRGHATGLAIDIDNAGELTADNLKGIDVAIEFSFPDSALKNISVCLEAGVPVVSGTTGWLKDIDRAISLCKANNTSFIHSSNFSIGVNLLFNLNKELAKQMDRHRNYNVSIEEIHHVKKLDAPSGTAITLADDIRDNNSGYEGWCFANEKEGKKVPVSSVREGMIPGIHTVAWESENDIISIRHESKNRKGLALGAVIAAEFIQNKKGVFTMNDVLGF